MAKTVYRLEVVRQFDSKEEAIRAAERQERLGGRTVTLFKERRTDSGQAFERQAIWKDLKQERIDRAHSSQRAT